MILLIGSTGYIGSEFVKYLSQGWNFKTLSYKKVLEDDLASHLFGVDFVINAAGYTGKPNVDKCEEEKDKCIIGNVVLPMKILEHCRRLNIPYGHVSSGCIYEGRRTDGTPWTEDDEPNFSFKQNNCSFYSGTKAMAEELVKEYSKSYIWRLRIPFDNIDNPRNYISKLLTYKQLVDFENSISHKRDFVKACVDMIDESVPYGIYNVVNSGTVTTEQVAYLISSYLDKKKSFEFFESAEEFYKIAAKTPRSNCVLDNRKLLRLGIKMRDVKEALIDSLQNWRKE